MSTNRKIVFLFSGQGSHYRGMGRELFMFNDVFKRSLMHSEKIMHKHIGLSLTEELYQIDSKPFDDLLVTHPAIIAVQIAMIEVMKELGISPDLALGASLGEFVSTVASGVITPEEALVTSIEQAKAIQQYALDGGMTAVLSERNDRINQLIDSCGLFVASDNFSGHFTVSGETENLKEFEKLLDIKHISFQRLEVAYPFHSPLLDNARGHYLINDFDYTFLSPSDTLMYSVANEKLVANDIDHEYFWKVARSPFNFGKVINQIESSYGPCTYIDLGPSGTMANFTKYNLSKTSESKLHMLMSPFKGVSNRLIALSQAIDEKNLIPN